MEKHWDFNEIVPRSGDSTLLRYQFSDGIAQVDLDLYELDAAVRITIPTSLVRGLPLTQGHWHLCHIRVSKISDLLTVLHNRYVPGDGFISLMKEVRAGLSLAYGKTADEAKYLVSLIGAERYFSCVVADISAISVEELNL